MADETPAEAAPELSEAEQAANQAHTDVNESEQGWSGKVEARLAALEEKAGIGQDKADEAATTEETS